jgi:hypothetical protein
MLLSLLPSCFMRISPNTQTKEYKNYCPSDKSHSNLNHCSMWHVTFCKVVLIGLICSDRVGQSSFSIVKDTPVDHNLLKLIKIMWDERQMFAVTEKRLPRVMKRYSPTGRRNHGRPLKRLLDTWDRNGSTSGPTPWHMMMINDTTKLLLKTTTVTNRPSRLMHWWSRFTTISITLTWEVIRHIFFYKFLVWDRVSLPNVSETLFFSNGPMKRNHKPTDRATGLPLSSFLEKSLRRMHGIQPTWDPCSY